jgi:hypothetical protein
MAVHICRSPLRSSQPRQCWTLPKVSAARSTSPFMITCIVVLFPSAIHQYGDTCGNRRLCRDISWNRRAIWRRGRDSNPRWACTHAAFRVRCIRPLCHLSAVMVGRCRRGALDNGWTGRLQGPICLISGFFDKAAFVRAANVRRLTFSGRLRDVDGVQPQTAAQGRLSWPIALTSPQPSVRDSAQSAWRVLPRRPRSVTRSCCRSVCEPLRIQHRPPLGPVASSKSCVAGPRG